MKKSVQLFPGNYLKRKIIHKAKFSRWLNAFLLEPLKQYSYQDKDTLSLIEPILYTDFKIAINITCPILEKDLLESLSKVYFPFDLYCKTPLIHKRKICFLKNLRNENLLTLPNKLVQYDYVMNIDNLEQLATIEPGFMEACLSLLIRKTTFFIGIGRRESDDSIQINPWAKPDFIEMIIQHREVTVEDLFYNHQVPIREIFLFSPKILKALGPLENKMHWEEEDSILFKKFLFLLAPKRSFFDKNFREEEFIPCKAVDIYEQSKEELFEKLSHYETVTFDIFDTLVTRTLLQPDDLFALMEKKSPPYFSIPFLEVRKRAEQEAREKLGHDVNLDEIYEQMQKQTHLSKEKIKKLKELEISLEMEHLIPRKEMVALFDQLVKAGVHVDLISDMYLKKELLEKMLVCCGIQNYRKLYISCQENKRKDTGTMWDFYFQKTNEKTVHVGDNYYSDYLAVLERGKPAVKILSSKDYLDYYGKVVSNSIEDSIFLGKLYNQLWLNSPFLVRKRMEEDLSYYGQYFLAPIFFAFFEWFEKVNTSSKILFISREGYYLQKIYQHYCKIVSKEEKENTYFLASRRATSLAACEKEEDLIELLDIEFTGSISDLFPKRYGFSFTKEMELVIHLPESKEEVIPFVSLHAKEILEQAKKERENYLQYFHKICPSSKEQLAIIDLGYSGTTQYYLSKLTNQKIEGYYFAITSKKLPQKLHSKIMGCFNTDNKTYLDEENLFYKKSLYLEAFLSAPEGQLICFDQGQPVFTNGAFNKQKKVYLDEIYEGVLIGFDQLQKIGFAPENIDVINQHYQVLCHFLKTCEGRLHQVFYMDDDYCTNGKEVRDLTKILK